jgi:hypothetical protein
MAISHQDEFQASGVRKSELFDIPSEDRSELRVLEAPTVQRVVGFVSLGMEHEYGSPADDYETQ